MHVAAVTAAKNFRGPLVGFPECLLCPIALVLHELALRDEVDKVASIGIKGTVAPKSSSCRYRHAP